MLIVGNGHVVTRDAKNQYFPDGAVAIDGTTICRVGQTANATLNARGPRTKSVHTAPSIRATLATG